MKNGTLGWHGDIHTVLSGRWRAECHVKSQLPLLCLAHAARMPGRNPQTRKSLSHLSGLIRKFEQAMARALGAKQELTTGKKWL